MASNSARDPSSSRRLRIPTALAVALVGSSASLAISFAGCDDARDATVDASVPTAETYAAQAPEGVDPSAAVDAGVDSKTADAAIDARPDAPPDARPDAPVV
jgi:hypothetical protein